MHQFATFSASVYQRKVYLHKKENTKIKQQVTAQHTVE